MFGWKKVPAWKLLWSAEPLIKLKDGTYRVVRYGGGSGFVPDVGNYMHYLNHVFYLVSTKDGHGARTWLNGQTVVKAKL